MVRGGIASCVLYYAHYACYEHIIAHRSPLFVIIYGGIAAKFKIHAQVQRTARVYGVNSSYVP
jgi:hypothetical protein